MLLYSCKMEDDRDMNDKWLEFAIRIQSIAQAEFD